MKSSVIILDLDGTIASLPTDYVAMRNELHKSFLKFGIDKSFRPLYKTIKTSCTRIEKTEGKEKAKVVYEEAMKLIEKFELNSIDKAEMKTGVHGFLNAMKNKGKHIAIFSSNTRRCVENVLEKFNIMDYVDFVVSANDVKELKPSPEGIFLISKRFNVQSQDIVMIGDSTKDILAAKNAEAKPVGIVGGISTRKELEDAGALAVCNNLSECIEEIE
ncbi:MAG: HAD family hydrolase [Candidatus Micrarchaeota archaeon]|nr:HAD family hydrolase [Candidatus Micrarchaeota archaeon]